MPSPSTTYTMKPIKLLLFFVLAALVLSACEHKDAIADDAAPLIELLSPKAGDTVHAGDSISISARLSDAGGLHEYIFRVQAQNSDTVFFYEGGHNHAQTEVVSRKIVLNSTKSTPLFFSVKANDHSDHQSEARVHFIVLP